MKNIFITITGINHYFGKKPFEIGRTVSLIKEPDNPYDKEAIGVYLPFIDKIGNVANSVNTVYAGTQSAGRIYDKLEEEVYAQVMFVTHSSVIALILPPDVNENQDRDTDSTPQNEKITSPSYKKEPLSKIGF
ncbi:MAG: HIRAN domain-containing protein [Clostridia bacterium]|nr:HIRAN domain-containing protein [Clostridia bacterium]